MNIKSISLTGGLFLFSAIAAYAITRKKTNQAEWDNINSLISNIGQTGAMGQNLQTVDPNTLPSQQPPYQYGDNCKEISLLQKAINKKYNSNLELTGTLDLPTMQVLCKNYWTLCFTWESDSYIEKYAEISQNDVDKLMS